MHIYKYSLILVLFCMSTLGYSQLVNNETELQTAISGASPGTTIILADGVWTDVFIDIDKDGTAENPITISAQNSGAVFMTGNSHVYMEGSYIIVTGLVFQDASNLSANGSKIDPVFELKRCNYCKILDNKIDTYNGSESQKDLTFKWILADGIYNEIAYNSFVGKYGVGSIINDNRNTSEPDYLSIHHNYFADRTPINELNEDNDQDAIRIGNSSTSLEDSYTEVYDNYFYNFFGEVEVISNKSGKNKYYNNTFRDYAGSLTLRHGDGCEVYGNYFFAENNTFSGGVRVIGEDHKVYNNYIEGINSKKADGSTSNATGGINVTNGRLNSAVNGYYQVKNSEIVNNTFVNCDYALRIGTTVSSDLDQEPINLTVANNIMYNTSVDEYQIKTEPSGNSVSEGNIGNLELSDMVDDGMFYRIVSDSKPVGSGIGSYPYLIHDVLGGVRDSDFDAGAEEFGAGGMLLPYDNDDVGVTVGFGAISSPTLSVAPLFLEFGVYGGTKSFEVISNVDWIIENNSPWLSFDMTSGSGRRTVTVTADENLSGDIRSTSISIIEVDGANNLETELTIEQSNTFIPSEINIVSATTIGMQDKEGISENNAYDDDLTTYWTGDPDTEEEVSITFDLSCSHVLTEIGINFWKADERTTTFSIDVAEVAEGPYTTIIDTETSEEVGVTVETEQIYDLGNTVARYVKFTGIGNSSSSNWTSIGNVNIYGDVTCEGTTDVIDIDNVNNDIIIYPVPVSNGKITISSKVNPLKLIEIYNVSGQKVISINGEGAKYREVDVSTLNAGVYIMKIEGTSKRKFIVK